MGRFHRTSGRQGGFTLIEIMASLIVFALLFGVILQILSTSVANTRLSANYTRAALWAQSRLDILGVDGMIEPGSFRGDFDDDFYWTMDIEETEVVDQERVLDWQEELPISLYYVHLTVWWDDGRRSAEFHTLRSVDSNWEERQNQGMLLQ